PSPAKHSQVGKVLKTCKGKSSLQLINEEEPTQPEPELEPKHQGEGDDFDVERTIKMSLESFQAQSQENVGGVAIQEPIAEATRQLPDDTSANIVHESSSHADAKTGVDTDKTNSGGDTEIIHIYEDQGNDADNQVNLEEKTAELDEGQARSDPGKTPKSQPPPEQEFMEEDQAGPDPGEPLSLSRTLSSMKNPDDAYAFEDRFLNDKSTEDEPGTSSLLKRTNHAKVAVGNNGLLQLSAADTLPRITANADGTSTLTISCPVTAEEKAQKKNDVKARSMLLMALSNEHLSTFNQYKDAKTLFDAIQARFGGNDATKKTQKTPLKQMYENFNLAQSLLTLSLTCYRKFLASWLFWQIHEDDLEEMDLKWPLALLSMRQESTSREQARRSLLMAVILRDMKRKRPRNQDCSRKTVIVEDTSSKAIVAIDGVGFDWSYMGDDKVPTNMALMAFSDSE
nr:ribonuclease H-like domain-containing protein [Tanacetum cinerariifolium]